MIGVLAFFAATRTQVGRDALRDQLEAQFADTFSGRLRIASLKGNLVNTLFAGDVRVFDPDGRMVLAIDSVIVRPSWRDLFRRELSLGDLILFRPGALLYLDHDGRWNLEKAFARVHPDTTRRQLLRAFSSTRIHVIDGTIETANQGMPPPAVRAGRVFNYAESKVEDLQVQATLDWRPTYKQIDLLSFSAKLTEPALYIEHLTGQGVIDGADLALNEVVLRAGQTTLRLNGSAGNLFPEDSAATFDPVFDLVLEPGTVDMAHVHGIFPALDLKGTLGVESRLHGPLSDLVVESAVVTYGASRVAVDGTLLGLPDSIRYELSFRDNTLSRDDVDAAWPSHTVPLPSRVKADLYTRGLLYPGAPPPGQPRFRGEAYLDLWTDLGQVRGTVSLTSPTAGPPGYRGDLVASGLNLGDLLDAPFFRSDLSGRVQIDGEGTGLDDLATTIRMNLRPSALAGVYMDTLVVSFSARARRLYTNVRLLQPAGSLQAEATLDLRSPEPSYQLDLTADRLDLGTLLHHDSLTTRLQTHLHLSGSGAGDPDLNATLALQVDSSRVRWGRRERAITPHTLHLSLAPRHTPGPRLVVDSDVLAAKVEGDVPLIALRDASRRWLEQMQGGIRAIIDKPYLSGDPDGPDVAAPLPSRDRKRLRTALRSSLVDAGLPDTLALRASLAVKDAAQLSAFLPFLPPLHARLKATLELVAGTDHFALRGALRADTLALTGIATGDLEAELEVGATAGEAFARSLRTTLQVRARQLTAGAQLVQAPALHFALEEGHGTLRISAAPTPRLGPVRLVSHLDLRPDRNRVVVDTLALTAGAYTWTGDQTNRFDLYKGAVVIPNLALTSPGASPESRQEIRLHGTLSSRSSDTLLVNLNNIVLRQLTDFIHFKPRFGGLLQGELALTRTGVQPELTGNLSVVSFSLDQYILGDLSVSSGYEPGQKDVRLDLDLTPTAFPDTAFVYGTDLPALVKRNRLRADGHFRLPGVSSTGYVHDPGALDLNLNVGRADLFFFKILISALDDVSGYATGTGHVGGAFNRPVFDADLDLFDGRFSVPDLNLHFDITSAVHVDEEAIHVPGAQISDLDGGTLLLTGKILFNDYKYFSFDLQGALDRLQIIDIAMSDVLPFYGHIRASGNATLTGPLSNAHLRSTDAATTPESELFVPVAETATRVDDRFIIFADSTGRIPDLQQRNVRKNLLAGRPVGERPFLEGIDLDIDLRAPPGSTVHLVIDPLLGDVINAVSTGRVQIQRREGEFRIFGTLEVSGGDYLFTAGEVFFRRFRIGSGGTLTWDGDPINAVLDIPATFRTRASRAGLPAGGTNDQSLIPLIVQLQISGRVIAPEVDLRLAIDRSEQNRIGDYQGLETLLNQPERATEYATSVLLTNSFRLTTTNLGTGSGGQLAFNSVSQLVSTQLNRFINEALPNVDFSFGLQGESTQDLDLTYGVALRLLDERLIIRGEGVYQGSGGSTDNVRTTQQSLQGEFVVEIRLSPSVSVEVFYRREGDALTSNATLTNTTGAGFSYQTEFPSWKRFFRRLFGWLWPDEKSEEPPPDEKVASSEEQP